MSTMTLNELEGARAAVTQTVDGIRGKIEENQKSIGLLDLLHLTSELTQTIAIINLESAIEVLIKEVRQ